eukprot:gnl/Carplike_NY0171/2564_a3445_453.p1 GENE.gnl/Carplike_NY0171/2564_a3445_453~~gnl/Carplike_NY0171/2564_a3445_453.p1  ORF type:complete len:1124 (+),score=363.86 gnl/Carplike_NY0171/2564_a3445_453:172-3372(+)
MDEDSYVTEFNAALSTIWSIGVEDVERSIRSQRIIEMEDAEERRIRRERKEAEEKSDKEKGKTSECSKDSVDHVESHCSSSYCFPHLSTSSLFSPNASLFETSSLDCDTVKLTPIGSIPSSLSPFPSSSLSVTSNGTVQSTLGLLAQSKMRRVSREETLQSTAAVCMSLCACLLRCVCGGWKECDIAWNGIRHDGSEDIGSSHGNLSDATRALSGGSVGQSMVSMSGAFSGDFGTGKIFMEGGNSDSLIGCGINGIGYGSITSLYSGSFGTMPHQMSAGASVPVGSSPFDVTFSSKTPAYLSPSLVFRDAYGECVEEIEGRSVDGCDEVRDVIFDGLNKAIGKILAVPQGVEPIGGCKVLEQRRAKRRNELRTRLERELASKSLEIESKEGTSFTLKTSSAGISSISAYNPSSSTSRAHSLVLALHRSLLLRLISMATPPHQPASFKPLSTSINTLLRSPLFLASHSASSLGAYLPLLRKLFSNWDAVDKNLEECATSICPTNETNLLGMTVDDKVIEESGGKLLSSSDSNLAERMTMLLLCGEGGFYASDFHHCILLISRVCSNIDDIISAATIRGSAATIPNSVEDGSIIIECETEKKNQSTEVVGKDKTDDSDFEEVIVDISVNVQTKRAYIVPASSPVITNISTSKSIKRKESSAVSSDSYSPTSPTKDAMSPVSASSVESPSTVPSDKIISPDIASSSPSSSASSSKKLLPQSSKDTASVSTLTTSYNTQIISSSTHTSVVNICYRDIRACIVLCRALLLRVSSGRLAQYFPVIASLLQRVGSLCEISNTRCDQIKKEWIDKNFSEGRKKSGKPSMRLESLSSPSSSNAAAMTVSHTAMHLLSSTPPPSSISQALPIIPPPPLTLRHACVSLFESLCFSPIHGFSHTYSSLSDSLKQLTLGISSKKEKEYAWRKWEEEYDCARSAETGNGFVGNGRHAVDWKSKSDAIWASLCKYLSSDTSLRGDGILFVPVGGVLSLSRAVAAACLLAPYRMCKYHLYPIHGDEDQGETVGRREVWSRSLGIGLGEVITGDLDVGDEINYETAVLIVEEDILRDLAEQGH